MEHKPCTFAGHHGTYTDYLNGCRCPTARAENTRRKTLQRLRPTPLVRSVGLSRRLRALGRMGWSTRRLSVVLGVGSTTITGLMNNDRTMVRDHTAALILVRYDELAATPGPSRRAEMSAITNGWAHPDEWIGVDIDDPKAKPRPCPVAFDDVVVGRLLDGLMRVESATEAERLAAVAKMFADGSGVKLIAHHLRMELSAVSRDLYRIKRIAGATREQARHVVRRVG